METVTTKEKIHNHIEKEELEKLNSIQEKTQRLIFELGEIEMIKIQLGNRKKEAQEFLDKITIEEKELTDSLFNKYGDVSVNPKNGEIT